MMKSPISKGRSRTIESEENRSLRMFWVASAMAMPPTPRPATSAVMSMPRLSSEISRTSDQTAMRAGAAMTPMVVARRPLVSSSNALLIATHSEIR